MSKRHAIGPTSATHYPNASVAAWLALGAQEDMEVNWAKPLRALEGSLAARNAGRFWSLAEDLGLVVQ